MGRPYKYNSKTVQRMITIPEELNNKIKRYGINLSEFINNNMRFLLNFNGDVLNEYKLEYESLIRERNVLNEKLKDLKGKIKQLEAFKSADLIEVEKVLKQSDFKIFLNFLKDVKENYNNIRKSHFMNFGKYPDDKESFYLLSEIINHKVLKLNEIGVVITSEYFYKFLKKV